MTEVIMTDQVDDVKRVVSLDAWKWAADTFGHRQLLPVVQVPDMPKERIAAKLLGGYGKRPSRIDMYGQAHGLKDYETPAVFATTDDTGRPEYGIGVKGHFAIDVDTEDAAVTAAVRAHVELIFGDIPIRVREGSAHIIVPFRAAPGSDVKKLRLRLDDRIQGGPAVEFLGTRGYYNLVGVHVKSGKRYEIIRQDATVPELTEEQWLALYNDIADLLAVPDARRSKHVANGERGEALARVSERSELELDMYLANNRPPDAGEEFRPVIWALALTWGEFKEKIRQWCIAAENGYFEDDFERNFESASLDRMPCPDALLCGCIPAHPSEFEEFEDGDRFAIAPQEKVSPQRNYVMTSEKNPKIKACAENFSLFLTRALSLDIKYDTFTSCATVNGKRFDADGDWLAISSAWDRMNGVAGSFSKQQIRDTILAVAKSNSFDSCVDYMSSLPAWDGVDRISTFWQTYAGAEGSAAYLAAVSRYFWTVLAGRMRYAHARPIKGDCVPVLCGAQGTLKSTLVQSIAPFPDWYASAALTSENADWCRAMGGKCIGELEEMVGYRSDEQSKKARLSALVDEWVEKYQSERTVRNRHYALIGTFNPDHGSGFLTDATGNRRYAPIDVVRPCDAAKAARDLEQLLAQGLCLFDGSGVLWSELDPLLHSGEAHAGHAAKAKDHDSIAEYLEDYAGDYITRDDLYRNLGLRPAGNAEERLRTAAAESVGWTYERRRADGFEGKKIRAFWANGRAGE